jgi:predicted TPR repeat methyltransferase
MSDTENAKGLFFEALAFMDSSRFRDAELRLREALQLAPDNTAILTNLSVALAQQHQRTKAREYAEKAISINPDNIEALLVLADCCTHDESFPEALAAYDKIVFLDPNFAQAHNNRGVVLQNLERYADALDSYDRAIVLDSDFSDARINRGNALRHFNRNDEALAAYDQALALNSSLPHAWLGRGNVFCSLNRGEEALAAYDQALARNPEFARAWIGRGDALRLLGRAPDSIAAYRQALKLGGDAASITYYLAALGAEPRPAAPPERFVADLFDSYADDFEHDVTFNLKYEIPILLADVVKRYASSNSLDILDMGCGTGLVGEHVRPLARSLTGVDLSANMLDRARQRQIYDHLFCCDLIEFLQTRDKAYDLAVAADVFIYVGELSLVFQAVRRALRVGGLFCFSIEATDDSDFVLRSTLRYAHSIGYVRKLASRYQFIVETIEPQVVRRGSEGNIDGYLAVMRCS